MAVVLQPWQILVAAFAGWISRHQDAVIEYLQEENRVLKQQLGRRRLRLTDDKRRRLAVRGKAIGRRTLAEVASLVTPDTIVRWHRRVGQTSGVFGSRPDMRRPLHPITSQYVNPLSPGFRLWTGISPLGPMKIALTREVSPSIARCELTHLPRLAIDLSQARTQHDAYCDKLSDLGCEVRRLPAEPDLPDAVFVEDTVVVLDAVAVLTRPGAASRRKELPAVAEALRPYRSLARIESPATLDGGDVMQVGKILYVGQSRRTDTLAVEQLRTIVSPHGYSVMPVAVDGCLHLKSAVTPVADDLLLLNACWVDPDAFSGMRRVEVDPAEPFGANALRLGDVVLHPEAFPRTRRRLEDSGVGVIPLDVSELAKAEGGLTCCSVIF